MRAREYWNVIPAGGISFDGEVWKIKEVGGGGVRLLTCVEGGGGDGEVLD